MRLPASAITAGASLLLQLVLMMMSLHLTESQWVSWGQCPQDTRAVRNFQPGDFLGTWYESRRFASWYQTGRSCVKLTLTFLNSTHVGVLEQSLWANLVPLEIGGAGMFTDGSSIASLAVSYLGAPVRERPNFVVLDTDYSQYALVWDCQERLGLSFQWLWLLTRLRYPDLKLVDAVLQRWSVSNLPVRDLLITDQLFCDLDH